MRFTVLIPTFNNGELIRPAIESVLAQTLVDFELLVVADGSPLQTHAIVQEYAGEDSRVRLLMHEKGERHGERYRHEAIVNASTEAVCYLCDDDFWFPDHLETMAGLLRDADFAHTRHVDVLPSLWMAGLAGDLADPSTRAAMRDRPYNFFGPTVAGHRLDAYRQLKEGWAPAPLDVWTDLNMWRKWISDDRMRLCSSTRITTLHMARSVRHHSDPAFLLQEPRAWYEAFKDPGMRLALARICPIGGEPFPLAAVFAEAHRMRADADAEVRRLSVELTQALSEGARLSRLPAERERALEDLRGEMLRVCADHSAALLESCRTRDALSEKMVELASRIGVLSSEVSQMSAEVRLREQALQTLAGISESRLNEAARSLAATQAEVAALRSSNSWKMTEPIRRLVSWSRGR